jgi:hypothetical protein
VPAEPVVQTDSKLAELGVRLKEAIREIKS